MKSLTIASLGGLLLAGCVLETDVADGGYGQIESDVLASNGTSLNGTSLNGTSLNGTSLNGTSLNGTSLNGTSLNGTSLNGVSAAGGNLSGVRSGVNVSGTAMAGALLQGTASDGSPVALRIDTVGKPLAAPNNDLYVYGFSYQSSGTWKPLCPGANEALVYPGTWNYGTARHQWDANLFSIGCRGATFAKCTELGYKGDARIDTYHQTCTRALRADYCGDGVSHTVNGTQINIYDRLGLQTDTNAWAVESNWTPDGAICLDTPRIPATLYGPNLPACISDRVAQTCATASWPSSVLIRTEVN